jgi:hypothetical protein
LHSLAHTRVRHGKCTRFKCKYEHATPDQEREYKDTGILRSPRSATEAQDRAKGVQRERRGYADDVRGGAGGGGGGGGGAYGARGGNDNNNNNNNNNNMYAASSAGARSYARDDYGGSGGFARRDNSPPRRGVGGYDIDERHRRSPPLPTLRNVDGGGGGGFARHEMTLGDRNRPAPRAAQATFDTRGAYADSLQQQQQAPSQTTLAFQPAYSQEQHYRSGYASGGSGGGGGGGMRSYDQQPSQRYDSRASYDQSRSYFDQQQQQRAPAYDMQQRGAYGAYDTQPRAYDRAAGYAQPSTAAAVYDPMRPAAYDPRPLPPLVQQQPASSSANNFRRDYPQQQPQPVQQQYQPQQYTLSGERW